MLRTRDTGYGSDAFARVATNERVLAHIEGRGPRAVWEHLTHGYIERAWYRRRLPPVTVQLTESPPGRMIAEHLAIREGRRWRHRDAQPALRLPTDFADYRRGRHRQAVRTNVNRARQAGLAVSSTMLEKWGPGAADFRVEHITLGPIERWMAHDPDGRMVGDSILSVDANVALLHGMTSTWAPARWLLHTAIVERLCGECELLLVNSAAVYRESYGSHHLQRLLGYDIVRLQVPDPVPAHTIAPVPAPEPVQEEPRAMSVA